MEKLFGMTVDNLTSYCESLLDCLCKNEDFVSFINMPNQHLFDEWARKNDSRPDCVQAFCGETKAVIYDDSDSFVMKIPFLWHSYYEKCVKTVNEDGSVTHHYDYTYSEGRFDYCRAEARNYFVAKREGFGRYFAPCYKLFDYTAPSGAIVPIYVMLKVDCDEDRVRDESFVDTKNYFVSCGTADYEDEDDLDEAVSDYMDDAPAPYVEWMARIYGDEGALEHFCDMNYINDVHAANIGFDCNGCPVIIDYSGFGDIERVADKEWWDVA